MDKISPKPEVSGSEGIMALPGFPVVLVSIQDNILTVAAISFFSFEPPMVMIGIVPTRYSFKLIQEAKDFVINVPSADLIDAVKLCGSTSGRGTNKFELAKFTPTKGTFVKSYLIEECPVNLECQVVHILNLKGSHVWFVGEVAIAHVHEDYDRSQALMYWPREYRAVGKILS